MIREININTILPVVNGVIEKGVSLAALPNTPLQALMNRSFPYHENQVSENPVETLKSATALMLDDNEEGHSVVNDAVVKQLADAISRHMTNARGVVIPTVKEIFTAVRERIAEEQPVPYSVNQLWLHPAVTSPLIQDLVERYENSNSTSAAQITCSPDVDKERLMSLLATGSANYDAQLNDLLSKVDVEEIYHNYFSGGYSGDLADAVRRTIRFDVSPLAVETNLIVFLLARALHDNPIEGTPKSLKEWEFDCSEYVRAAGTAIQNTFLTWDKMAANDVLIVRPKFVAPGGTDIFVYGPNYQRYLEAGGDVEMVIGALVGGKTDFRFTKQFLDNAETLKAIYNRWIQQLDNRRLADSANEIKNGAVVAITEAINALSDERNICKLPTAQMHATLAAEVGKYTGAQWSTDTYKTIRELVCKVMFTNSNALDLAELIDEYTEKHQLEDVRLAAYHAVKTLLVEHMLSQTTKV